jgi:CheY-like chemotaxis protein
MFHPKTATSFYSARTESSVSELAPAPDAEGDRVTSVEAVPVGMLIDGNYRVLGPLGEGAMGMVYLARDERLDRLVAVKIVRKALLERHDAPARFLDEARAMARVRSPYVVNVHHFGDHEGSPYFVMELMDGPTLEQWRIAFDGPPPLEHALALLEQVCLGVQAIHEANTVHHDLKPSNVLIDREGRIAVSDLGLAQAFRRASSTHRAAMCGTLEYMAPEIVGEHEIQDHFAPRADVYSLGCMTYELVTGQLPFARKSDAALMVSHLVETPPPPSEVRPDLPPGLDDIVMRALAKNPADRTASAAELRESLATMRQAAHWARRILLVEDDEDFRELVAQHLTRTFPGMRVDQAGGAEVALAAFDREAYDAVICDLGLPDVDGVTLTTLLRQRRRGRDVPLVVLTGSGGPEEWRRLAALGADGFLVKPVHLEDVSAMLTRVFRDHDASQALTA